MRPTYWYVKSVLRWMSVVAGLAALIIIGVLCGSHAAASGNSLLDVDPILLIVAPLLSFITSVFATTLLFGQRRNSLINPGWLLAGDLFNALFLLVILALNRSGDSYYWSYSDFSGSGIAALMDAPWGLNLALAILHGILFLLDTWEVNTYRRMMREQCEDANVEDLETGPSASKSGFVEPHAVSEDIELQSTTSAHSPRDELMPSTPPAQSPDAMVGVPGTLRVELPDGRILELPEGCRVELPAEHRVEMPNNSLRINTRPFELDATSTASTQWYNSPSIAPSYKTRDWNAT
ncbi:hypothetical protein D6D01_00761 [Aureobasidium pullulans]|uniref:Uncharacterized protein n=1 Tax=Aureobasidium pullulans TaxID=5580 RepID=A0A4V4JY67_AURPU|nr:hypothetical protein D6D01_00761 [Aureobasidium pullulans]